MTERGHHFCQVLVPSDRSEAPTSPSGAVVHTVGYDFIVHNVSTLRDLGRNALRLVNLVLMRSVFLHEV
jgi:hypothetical protein